MAQSNIWTWGDLLFREFAEACVLCPVPDLNNRGRDITAENKQERDGNTPNGSKR